MKIKSGFTLIELLIVVLIIAILAAIAVPNFLEFQVRAKVSRVLSDMRTITLAVEAYTVDNNRAPIGYGEARRLGLATGNQDARQISMQYMTTPIAYMSTILVDPFSEKGRLDSLGNHVIIPWYEYNFNDYKEPATAPGGGSYDIAYESGFRWWVWSFGPAKIPGPPFPPAITGYGSTELIYDPTNGTASIGYIVRTNKGIYPN